ncbi:MAG TPA: hypothetical protein PLT07_11790, partial [Trueperaceae bacterium]|nr:hypothetical protein [Trueperaceae bacterium]
MIMALPSAALHLVASSGARARRSVTSLGIVTKKGVPLATMAPSSSCGNGSASGPVPAARNAHSA